MVYKLREICVSDLIMLRRHRNQASTRKWLENTSVIDSDSQLKWYESNGHHSFKIIVHDVFGDIGIARLKKIGDCTAEIGLDIFNEYRGRGMAKQAFSAVVDQARLDAKKLVLWVFLENKNAVTVYKSAGFVYDYAEPVRYYMRDWCEETKAFAYVKMVLI